MPESNKNRFFVLYSQVSDICAAFQREFALNKKEGRGVKIQSDCDEDELQEFCKEFLDRIDQSSYSKNLKNRAKGVIGQLNSSSLKMIIYSFYSLYKDSLKQITENEVHLNLGISKSISSDDFKQFISDFVDIRNKIAHVGILWNDGIKIYIHLKILIYFSVLNGSGFSIDEIICLISYLFGSFF